MILVDPGTLTTEEGGTIAEFRTDASYQGLYVLENGEVYAVNPHISIKVNNEMSFGNAYYIGKVIYPDRFADIDPAAKSDEIYQFMVDTTVYEQLKLHVQNQSYQKVNE